MPKLLVTFDPYHVPGLTEEESGTEAHLCWWGQRKWSIQCPHQFSNLRKEGYELQAGLCMEASPSSRRFC